MGINNLIRVVRKEKEKKKLLTPIEYRNGGEGCAQWIEDFCFAPVYPEGSDIAEWISMGELPDIINPKTNRSHKYIWEEQKKILKDCLRMENGRFLYSLIVFCWMRGEGKSFLLCLVLLWKFFNWPRQLITLGANSKDQVKFVHFDIMSDTIKNSPKLLTLIGGERNLQEKEIILRDSKGNKKSTIRSISSFSGIVSNITGYSFSEIFDMKNPKFFVQLDGSIRNMPNSFGMIDSTVSAKTHVLYDLYQNSILGKTKKVYFSYRSSNKGDVGDYWHPNMDADQLNDYRAKFPFGEFERYFLNKWSSGSQKTFSDEMIEEMGIMGVDNFIMGHNEIKTLIEEKHELLNVMEELTKRGLAHEQSENILRINVIDNRFVPVERYYSLKDKYNNNLPMSIEQLNNLGEIFDTRFAVLAGADFADPYAMKGIARTIVSVMAKGLIGSKSNPYAHISIAGSTPQYVYFLMSMYNIETNSLDDAKKLLEELNEEYDGIDTFCSERFGAWDMSKWCEDRDIAFEPIYPNYGRQRDAFREVFMAVKDGRFKAPAISIHGSKKEDILREEMSLFDHDPDRKWFGSPEKLEKHGVQDDVLFSIAWCMYGGRMLTPDEFRLRKTIQNYGFFIPNRGLLGKYA